MLAFHSKPQVASPPIGFSKELNYEFSEIDENVFFDCHFIIESGVLR